MIPFVDIHTHFPKSAEGLISIQNFTQNEWENRSNSVLASRLLGKGRQPSSAGLHPWYLTKENAEKDFERLAQFADNQNVVAIGECGLDRLRGESLDFQTAVFAKQIQLAESVQKPVVIHCVRAYNEVITLKKKLKPSIPLIIHGFNKNESVLRSLLDAGFYISIGTAILRGDKKFNQMVLQIPLEQLFFETDDTDMAVHSVYAAYSEIAKINLSTLKSIIYGNCKKVFSKGLGSL